MILRLIRISIGVFVFIWIVKFMVVDVSVMIEVMDRLILLEMIRSVMVKVIIVFLVKLKVVLERF